MAWDQIEGRWKQLKGKVRAEWGKPTVIREIERRVGAGGSREDEHGNRTFGESLEPQHRLVAYCQHLPDGSRSSTSIK